MYKIFSYSKVLLVLVVLIFLQIRLVLTFQSLLPLWENAIKVQRKQVVTDETLNFWLNISFRIIKQFENLVIFLDDNLPLFPSYVKANFWSEPFVYTLLSFPILAILSVLIVVSKKRIKIAAIIFLFFWLVPAPRLLAKNIDTVVTNTNFNLSFPWTPETEFIWIFDEKISPYSLFEYSWNQSSPAKYAKINVSCLGHYQLFVNGKVVYRGPSFAVPPTVYFDTLDIARYIQKGENKISIICNFVEEIVHEYAHYQKPAILIGGAFSDGILTKTFSDYRLWKGIKLENIKNGQKIFDAGYTEEVDLTKLPKSTQPVGKLNLKGLFIAKKRPLPLLKYQIVAPKKISDQIYDLFTFSTGFLQINSNLEEDCKINVKWGIKVDQIDVPLYMAQLDKVILPKGKFTWDQFSRRSGRYIKLDHNCKGSIEVNFQKVGVFFDDIQPPQLSQELDRKIYNIGMNSLIVNVQDHIEDSVDREKAMYLGDSLAVSKCLLASNKESKEVRQYLKEMIQLFSESQNPDGSFFAMTPTGKKFIIPAFALQWTILLDQYLKASSDIEFAKQVYPTLERLLDWAKSNETSEGFIYDKYQKDWWMFIDWAERHLEFSYDTALQIWYINVLEAADSISNLLGTKADYKNRKERLKNNLIKFAYDSDSQVFPDSFDLDNNSEGTLLTNALAGRIGLFPTERDSRTALDHFKNNYFLDTPYSQTWVIEWMIKLGMYDLALDTLRIYWGGMVNDGATSIYERYNVKTREIGQSYSHAWGCGPVFLYRDIAQK